MKKAELFAVAVKAIIEGYQAEIADMAKEELTQQQAKKTAYKLGIIQGLIMAQELLIEAEE